jgi:hypothetical protein
VHGLSSNNHSFWRGNRIFKIGYFQNVVPRVPVKRSKRRCFSLWPVLQQNAFAAKCRVTNKQTDKTKWINIYDSQEYQHPVSPRLHD